ncbi:dihydropteroate synthase [Alphaproteobacteria bacterium]|nr:dihydropteroate synthase [Alphaproteobacteria bacterium]
MEKINNLYFPAFSEEIETYVCPIPKSYNDVPNGLRLAKGWRYFNELKVIQEYNNIYSEVIMTPKELIKSAASAGNSALQEAEKIIHNLTKKRNSFSNMNMSYLHIMGIINLTPDSFYKASQKENVASALETAIKMDNDGASIIDLGGESSKPGAIKISADEEQKRVIPSINEIKNISNLKAKISLDTCNLSTMQRGKDNGVDIINDISGFVDVQNISFISKKKIPIIVMHMQNDPKTMQQNPQYDFSPIDIYKILSKKIKVLLKLGVLESNIVIDPGFGFGKNVSHNLEILNYLSLFHGLGVPILIGLSRKSLIADITIDGYRSFGINKKIIEPSNRLSGSIVFAIHGYNNGIQIIRTHDVFETRQAIFCQKSIS